MTQRLIDTVLAGPDPDARQAISGLTVCEVEILVGVGRGPSNREIAAAVHLSEATVKAYRGRVLTKTARRDRAQLVVLAHETGLIRPGQN